MDQQPRIEGVCGSLRSESVTRIAIREALDGVSEHGGDPALLDLREYRLPMYDPTAPTLDMAETVTDRLEAADAIILGTPMYHGSYSGVLKNVIDYCGFDEFEHKTIGLIGVAGGQFPITALEHLRSVCRSLNAWVIPTQAAVPRSKTAVADGRIIEADIRDRLQTLGRQTVEYANIEPDPPCFESTQNVGANL